MAELEFILGLFLITSCLSGSASKLCLPLFPPSSNVLIAKRVYQLTPEYVLCFLTPRLCLMLFSTLPSCSLSYILLQSFPSLQLHAFCGDTGQHQTARIKRHFNKKTSDSFGGKMVTPQKMELPRPVGCSCISSWMGLSAHGHLPLIVSSEPAP